MSVAPRSRYLTGTSSALTNVEGAMTIDMGYPPGVKLYYLPPFLVFPVSINLHTAPTARSLLLILPRLQHFKIRSPLASELQLLT